MAQHRVCPWWLGYLLASPLRRLLQDPEEMLAPFVRPGMTVLEPGPGMGFFTIPIAQMVGESGCIYSIDVQRKMLEVLKRRAEKYGLSSRVRTRLASADSLNAADLAGKVDLVWAYAVVHEMPSEENFFAQVAPTLKPDATIVLAEPAGHVSNDDFDAELSAARRHGLVVSSRPELGRSLTAVLKKST